MAILTEEIPSPPEAVFPGPPTSALADGSAAADRCQRLIGLAYELYALTEEIAILMGGDDGIIAGIQTDQSKHQPATSGGRKIKGKKKKSWWQFLDVIGGYFQSDYQYHQ